MRPAPGAAPASPSAARELRQDPDAAARARTRPLARASAGAAARGRAMGADRRHPGSARDARARARGGGAGGGGARGPRAGAGNGEPPGVARRVGASGAARGGPGDSRAGRPDRAGRASGADAPPPLAAATALLVREARDRGAPYDRGRALRRGARRPRRRGHPGAGRNRAGQRRARRMAGSAAQRRAPARGGMARPRGRGGRGGAALEPGARVARAVAAVALAAAHPLDASRRGTGVAGARARWLRARSGMVGHAAGVLVDCLSFADSTDAVLRVGVGPAKWATGLVVGPDVLYQLAPQIRGRREDAAREAVALDLRKPELDLIEPRAVGRREMQGDARMRGEPRG